MLFGNKNIPTTIQLDYTKPFIVLNFKTYKEGTGANAVRLARIAEKVQAKTKLNIIVCVQAIDLKEVASSVKIPVYAQHSDNNQSGRFTGSIVPEHLVSLNVHGSLLNHSEKRIKDMKELQNSIIKLKELNMKSIVCAENEKEAKKISQFKPIRPDFIAIEPPDLIGGEISVSSAKPEVIQKFVRTCQEVPFLVGAGVKDNSDVKIALNYGVKGVLLSSHYVLSKDPEKFLLDLITGLY